MSFLQGALFSTPDCLKTPQDLVKLYLHESNRVYRDKMMGEKDFNIFDNIQAELVKKFFDVCVLLQGQKNKCVNEGMSIIQEIPFKLFTRGSHGELICLNMS